MTDKPLVNMISGRRIEPWVQDYLDRRENDVADPSDAIVASVSEAFRTELHRIMQPTGGEA